MIASKHPNSTAPKFEKSRFEVIAMKDIAANDAAVPRKARAISSGPFFSSRA